MAGIDEDDILSDPNLDPQVRSFLQALPLKIAGRVIIVVLVALALAAIAAWATDEARRTNYFKNGITAHAAVACRFGPVCFDRAGADRHVTPYAGSVANMERSNFLFARALIVDDNEDYAAAMAAGSAPPCEWLHARRRELDC